MDDLLFIYLNSSERMCDDVYSSQKEFVCVFWKRSNHTVLGVNFTFDKMSIMILNLKFPVLIFIDAFDVYIRFIFVAFICIVFSYYCLHIRSGQKARLLFSRNKTFSILYLNVLYLSTQK